jgi:hypothetical protein
VYEINVQNHGGYLLTTSDGSQIKPTQQWSVGKLGNVWVRSDEFGTANFLDLGDVHIPGDSKETWGVLISYQGEEFVGRYEGEGLLIVQFNAYGQITLGNMDLRQVALPAIQTEAAEAALKV